MENSPDTAFITALPKAELHCHLDGSLRPARLLELLRPLSTQNPHLNLPVHSEAALLKALHAGAIQGDLGTYLRAFDLPLLALQTREALHVAVMDLLEDAQKDGVVHLEIRFCPALHTQNGLTADAVLSEVCQSAEQAGTKNNMSVGVIVCALRSRSAQESAMLAKLAVKYSEKYYVSFDFAGQELNNSLVIHQEALSIIKKNKISCTIHAGEAAGPESVVEALSTGVAARIGHGTRSNEDAALLEKLAEDKILLEVCLSSNLQTGTIASLKAHPLRQFLQADVPFTLCTDNRLVSATNLVREYEIAASTFALSRTELIQIARMGIEHAFIEPEKQRKLLDELDRFASDARAPAAKR